MMHFRNIEPIEDWKVLILRAPNIKYTFGEHCCEMLTNKLIILSLYLTKWLVYMAIPYGEGDRFGQKNN